MGDSCCVTDTKLEERYELWVRWKMEYSAAENSTPDSDCHPSAILAQTRTQKHNKNSGNRHKLLISSSVSLPKRGRQRATLVMSYQLIPFS